MTVVVDSSGVLALLLNEPVLDEFRDAVGGAMISAVNIIELVGVMGRHNTPPEQCAHAVTWLGLEVIPLTAQVAASAGALEHATRAYGLSLADRACLALAASVNATVWTADRQWLKCDLGIRIKLVR